MVINLQKDRASQKAFSASTSAKLIKLLEALKEGVLTQECSQINSSIVDCCDFIVETLGKGEHAK